MKIEINIPSLEALDEAARQFMAHMGDYTVYGFYGQMGAGKKGRPPSRAIMAGSTPQVK